MTVIFGETITQEPPEAEPPCYAGLYRTLYDGFPQQSRTVGRPSFSMIKARQSTHETTDPSVDYTILRTVSYSALKRCSVDCGEGEKPLSPRQGSFYLAPPNAIADWKAEGAHDITLLAIPSPALDALHDWAGMTHNPLAPILNTEVSDPMLSHLMETIWSSAADKGPAATLLVDGLFLTLLGRLVQQADRVAGGAPTQRRVPPLDAVRLARVTEYIEAHLDQALPMHQLAEVACLSQHHFARAFRTATGQSPHAYLTARRIARACALLQNPGNNVAGIAQACGFGSQAHLSTAFKKAMGMPPTVYRRSVLEG